MGNSACLHPNLESIRNRTFLWARTADGMVAGTDSLKFVELDVKDTRRLKELYSEGSESDHLIIYYLIGSCVLY